jgi:hypothetical protein
MQVTAEPAVSREADKGLVQQCGEANRRRALPGTRAGYNRHELILGKRFDIESAGIDVVGNDANVGNFAAHGIEHIVAGEFLEIDVKVGMLDQKASEEGRQGPRHCGRVAKQAHRAAQAPAEIGHLGVQGVEFEQHTPRMPG